MAQMMMIMTRMVMIYSELSLLLAGVALRDCPPPLTCSCLSLGVLKNISSGNEILINRPLVKSAYQFFYFFYFSAESYVVGTRKNGLNETVLLSTKTYPKCEWVSKY